MPSPSFSTETRATKATSHVTQKLPTGLYRMVALLVIAHTAFNGVKITTALAAIDAGGGALWVGILAAMFNVIPAFLAIWIGRRVDRYPLRQPLVIGCVLIAAFGALAAFEPTLGVLLVATCGMGLGWMAIAAASQYAVGMYGSEAITMDEGGDSAKFKAAAATIRVKAFSVMAIGFSISGFVGPLAAGFLIDHVSFRAAFAVLALLPVVAAYAFWSRRFLKLPTPTRIAPNGPARRARDLLAVPVVRNTLGTIAFITVGWDLFNFMVPVLGSELKLSATQIGSVLSFFAVAVFLVRLSMPWLSKRLGERGVITTAMVIAGTMFVAFAFAKSYSTMLVLSFIMGLGLGSSQPIMLSLLHSAAPPNRIGEVNGMRMTMISTSQWTMPLMFGTLTLSAGLAPLFAFVGTGLLLGSVFAHNKLPNVIKGVGPAKVPTRDTTKGEPLNGLSVSARSPMNAATVS
jgi:MFS family permease